MDWIALVVGLAIGGSVVGLICRIRVGNFGLYAVELLRRAEQEGEAVRYKAQLAAKDIEAAQLLEVRQDEERLQRREERLEERAQGLDKQLGELSRGQRELERLKAEFAAREVAVEIELHKLANLDEGMARELVLARVEQTTRQRCMVKVKEVEAEADEAAARIITTAINRLAVPTVSEVATTTVFLPNDELKGRIIGREGRNIRVLEQLTGVNLIVDETPGAVVISNFDPVRRQVAKAALSDLVADGRIHPTTIEAAVAKAHGTVDRQIREFGEEACVRAGAIDMHPDLITLLGKLKFRYSMGQNILDHSLEVSALLGMMAAECKLDQQLARRIGLLHDVGKAVSHEISGSHALVGRDLVAKYGEMEAVANGIGCHHGEIEPTTVVGSLCGAADALSASRLGARIEAVEQYVKRNTMLEEIAQSLDGVQRAYALQAGREVRVIVEPTLVGDEALSTLARQLTKQIEESLTYPGKIRVTVMRETKATDYAI